VREWDLAAAEAARAAGVDPRDYPAYTRFCAARRRVHPQPSATIADVVAHVERVREVAGIDHVGIGGDYDGCDVLPVGLGDVSCYPALLAALAERGWSREHLGRLTFGNMRRVLSAVERATRS
jgi:membrane dipeptidase